VILDGWWPTTKRVRRTKYFIARRRRLCIASARHTVDTVSVVSIVLLVDDDDDLREVLREFLLGEGVVQCVTATSLAEVQSNVAAALAAGLAIVDVNLGPGQATGVEVCRWLRAQGFAAPIVFLTGHAASDPRVIEALAMANARVLSKPIGIDEITRLVTTGP
jgi:DNA-binding response OmpR family regulator